MGQRERRGASRSDAGGVCGPAGGDVAAWTVRLGPRRRAYRATTVCSRVAVYTPGSRAATPLAVLSTLVPSVGGNDEEASARLTSTADSILALADVADESAHSRERVLIATLLEHAARGGLAVDLPWLVQQVQKPPFDRVGVLDLETFYPARERQALGLRLNAVLASPGFEVWLSGEPVTSAGCPTLRKGALALRSCRSRTSTTPSG
jgi:hypothetical protein